MESIQWYKLPHCKDKGYEITHHTYSDTFTMRVDGRRIMDENASMNHQGDMTIYWIEDQGNGAKLGISAHSERHGEYGSHEEFKKIAERLSGLKFKDMARR